MKPLIATTCLCLIAAVGWFAITEYDRIQRVKVAEIETRCAPVWLGEFGDRSGKSQSELRSMIDLVEECTEYRRTGY